MVRVVLTAALLAPFCLVARPASADVLEIDPAGSRWIAGGPVVTEPATQDVSQTNFVTPAASAGPAAWRPYVSALAAKYDLSTALIEALVWQESRWNQTAVSPAGARGLTQLMPGTARDLGVNPDDPWQNLEGGARYLRKLLNAFDGDVVKALAAYNAGPDRVRRAGGVPRIAETENYVAAILGHLTSQVRR